MTRALNLIKETAIVLGGALLPLPIIYSKFAIFIVALLVLFTKVEFQRSVAVTKNRDLMFIILSALAYWTFFSILIHPPILLSFFERFLPLAVFPVLFFLKDFDVSSLKKQFMMGFIIGNLFMGVFNLALAAYRSTSITDGGWSFDSTVWGGISVWESIDHVGNYFFSYYFTNSIHPSYWSLYLVIGACFLFCNPILNGRPFLKWSIIIFFLGLIYLSSSRAGMIGTFIAIVSLVAVRYKERGLPVYLGIGVIILATIILVNPRLLGTLSNGEYRNTQRWQTWEAAFDVAKDAGLTGFGFQHSEQVLLNEYHERDLTEHYELRLNAHNQFIETLIRDGFIGLSLLIFIFIFGLYRAFKARSIFQGIILMNVFFHFCFESMLNRYYGIMIFALILPILLGKESCHITTVKSHQ